MAIFEGMYGLFTLFNYGHTISGKIKKEHFKNEVNFSNLEKLTLGGSVLIGIDAVITPLFIGESLHNLLGVNLDYCHEQGLMSLEFLGAYSGMFYHAAKNFKQV